jgi:hypothetical protein
VLIQQTIRAHYWRSILRLSTQTLFHGINGSLINIVWELYFMIWVNDRLKFLYKVKLGEWRPAVDHLVENATERPHVGCLCKPKNKLVTSSSCKCERVNSFKLYILFQFYVFVHCSPSQ